MKSKRYEISINGQVNPSFKGEETPNVKTIKIEEKGNVVGEVLQEDILVGIPDDQLGTKYDLYQGWRLGLQATLILVWLCLGFYQELIGPTLPDLKDRLGVNYEEISLAASGRDMGVLVGSLIGGPLMECFYTHTVLILGVCVLLPAGITAALPHLPHLALTFTFFILNGIMEGVMNACGNTMVMHMWGERSASPMNALHGGYGVASIIVPFFVSPFLGPDDEDNEDTKTTTMYSITTDNFTLSPPKVSRIEIPYGIAAGICVIGSAVVFFVYCKNPPEQMFKHTPSKSFKEMARPSLCGMGHTYYAVELLICLFFYFFQTVGMARTYGNFIFSYAYETKQLGFTKSSASMLTTVYWIGFTVGRVGGAVVAHYVPTQLMIVGKLVGTTVAVTIIAALAYEHALALWICTPCMGAFIGIMYPLGMAWANIYLHMNSVAVTVLLFGASIGGTCYAFLVGSLFDKDTRNWTYVLCGWCVGSVAVYIMMQFLASCHGKHIHEEHQRQDNTIQISDGIQNDNDNA